MYAKLRQWLLRTTGHNDAYARKFFAQFQGRTLIVHSGLRIDWLKELLSLGAGAFICESIYAVPIRAKLQRWIGWSIGKLPLRLPLPLLLDVRNDRIDVRHLQRFGSICLPTDIAWIVEDMRTRKRVHASLRCINGRFDCIQGIPIDDNRYFLEDGIVI